MNAPAPVTTDLYLTFTGSINEPMARGVITALNVATNKSIQRVHLLIHSTGGSIPDGIALYNYVSNAPMEVITYNGGAISSIAVLLYLAGKARMASETATFMIHKGHWHSNPDVGVTASQLDTIHSTLLDSDARIEGIIRKHVEMPQGKWEAHKHNDLTLSAALAIEYKIAHRIGDFRPPIGAELFAILPLN